MVFAPAVDRWVHRVSRPKLPLKNFLPNLESLHGSRGARYAGIRISYVQLRFRGKRILGRYLWLRRRRPESS